MLRGPGLLADPDVLEAFDIELCSGLLQWLTPQNTSPALPWRSWCLRAASPQLPPAQLMASWTSQDVR